MVDWARSAIGRDCISDWWIRKRPRLYGRHAWADNLAGLCDTLRKVIRSSPSDRNYTRSLRAFRRASWRARIRVEIYT